MRRYRLLGGLGLLCAVGVSAAEPGLEAKSGLTLLTAVRWTLERDPNVAISESRREAARGEVERARGDFDALLTASAEAAHENSPELSGDASETRSLETRLGLLWTLRSGLSLEPELTLSQVSDPNSTAAAVDRGTVTFRIRQPLLRGRGREVTTAREVAAEYELTAAGLDLEQRIAERLLAVVNQYWAWLAAERNLAVFRASEEASRVLLEKTRQLIAADQVPAAELVQLEANLAAKESSTLGGLQAVFGARQDLGREIGLDAAEILALPPPSDAFPALDAAVQPEPSQAAGWIERARARRADHRAALARRAAGEILRRAAEANLRPRLDLIFAPSWSGLDRGTGAGPFFSPLVENVPGASASLGLSLSWPTTNRDAEGALLQAEAGRRQRDLAVELVAKAIGADVPAALDGLDKSARRLAKARQAESLFERAVVNEEKKLRAGTSTLLDLISQQDRLTAARQNVVSAELALALALARLRFDTGTLFAGGEAVALAARDLVTFPEEDEP